MGASRRAAGRPGQTSRRDVTRTVMRAMRDPRFVDYFHVRSDDGSVPVMVALESDRVSDVASQVEDRGGRANVVVAHGRALMIVAFESDGPGGDAEGAGTQVIHQDINMGMLSDFIRTIPRGSVHLSVQVNRFHSAITDADELNV